MVLEKFSFDILPGRIFRPQYTRRLQVRAQLAHCSNAREAWESLATAGLIPEEWVDHPNRTYSGYERHRTLATTMGIGRDTWASTYVEQSPYPPNIESAMTLASGLDGVLTAEQLANEFVNVMKNYVKSYRKSFVLRWEVYPTPFIHKKRPGQIFINSIYPTGFQLPQFTQNFRRSLEKHRGIPANGTDSIIDALVEEAQLYFAFQQYLPNDVNPFEIQFALWNSGYAMIEINEDQIVLGAKQL